MVIPVHPRIPLLSSLGLVICEDKEMIMKRMCFFFRNGCSLFQRTCCKLQDKSHHFSIPIPNVVYSRSFLMPLNLSEENQHPAPQVMRIPMNRAVWHIPTSLWRPRNMTFVISPRGAVHWDVLRCLRCYVTGSYWLRHKFDTNHQESMRLHVQFLTCPFNGFWWS